MNAALNISETAVEHLRTIHARWETEKAVLSELNFARQKHVGFFRQCLTALPGGSMAADSSR